MAINIFEPEVSTIVKGMQGKTVLIYGTNRTGKTKNAVKAPKPFVIAFERGLNAINGVPYQLVEKWSEFLDVVKQLTKADTINKVKEIYSTIIIDTIEGMAEPASKYVCGIHGCATVGDGNNGYGIWKEYSQALEEPIKKLTNAGFTVVFLAHEGEREFLNEAGVKYTKIFPRGDKRVVNPVCDICDVIAYAQLQPNDDENKEVRSTLYLKGNSAFHAGSRFSEIAPRIEEWTWDKLDKAIAEAITAEEKNSGKKGITLEESLKAAAKKEEKIAKETRPLTELKEEIIKMATYMNQTEGNIETYNKLKKELLGTTDFKASAATEDQREQVEVLYQGLCEKGYYEKAGLKK